MSSSFDVHAIAMASRLLLDAEQKTPHWVQFSVSDNPWTFSRMLSWLVNHHTSPMHQLWRTERATRPYVIEWKTEDDWLRGLSYRDEQTGRLRSRRGVFTASGARLGRFRFRAEVTL